MPHLYRIGDYALNQEHPTGLIHHSSLLIWEGKILLEIGECLADGDQQNLGDG
jgi:hypothetical protein